MELLKNNYKKAPQVFYVTCPYCGSELKYDENDIQNPFKFVKCPACHNSFDHLRTVKKIVNKFKFTDRECDDCNEEDWPCIDDIVFPNYEQFYHFGQNRVKISNEQTNQMIKDSIKYLKNNPEEHFCRVATGDTTVIIFHYVDYDPDECECEYEVIVAKNYYSAEAKS